MFCEMSRRPWLLFCVQYVHLVGSIESTQLMILPTPFEAKLLLSDALQVES
jgi:hypothetical protein